MDPLSRPISRPISHLGAAALPPAGHAGLRGRLTARHGLGPAVVVAGLALTVLWLGLVAWGAALLVNAAM
jgi:hypothetical protein